MGGVGFPTWHPSGMRLAFEWSDSICVMADDGSGLTPIRPDEGAGDDSKWAPSWSPLGGKIAYVEGTGEHSGSIYVMNANGSSPVSRTKGYELGNVDSAPDWSPDGTRIAFQRYLDCLTGSCTNAVDVMRANGAGLRLLVRDAAFPSWSPDGRWIAFVRRAGGASEIFKIRVDGSGLTRLTRNAVSDFSPDWQPQ